MGVIFFVRMCSCSSLPCPSSPSLLCSCRPLSPQLHTCIQSPRQCACLKAAFQRTRRLIVPSLLWKLVPSSSSHFVFLKHSFVSAAQRITDFSFGPILWKPWRLLCCHENASRSAVDQQPFWHQQPRSPSHLNPPRLPLWNTTITKVQISSLI